MLHLADFLAYQTTPIDVGAASGPLSKTVGKKRSVLSLLSFWFNVLTNVILFSSVAVSLMSRRLHYLTTMTPPLLTYVSIMYSKF